LSVTRKDEFISQVVLHLNPEDISIAVL